MERQKQSLEDMSAFKEVDLPPGKQTIGLKWVYAYKTNLEGVNILEKARVVAQGYSQQPGQFEETYAPVAKITSVRVLLTWAAVQNLEIY
jgi:Reverse transcriptase (RNA-dependent DNA polymerase)